MIYVTGDCHREWNRFSVTNFPQQKYMTRDDVVIVCGDFGIWRDDRYEQWWLKWLEEKPFTILFVDGNHENHGRLNNGEFPTVERYGGKVHQIRQNVFHLMRGYVYEICGKKVFAFGGARSHDIADGILDPDDYPDEKAYKSTYIRWMKAGKRFRINRHTWWAEEMPSAEEMAFGLENLRKNDYSVDFIISHCCPHSIICRHTIEPFAPDPLTEYFDKLASMVNFEKWVFGHYHNDTCVLDRYLLFFHEISRIV